MRGSPPADDTRPGQIRGPLSVPPGKRSPVWAAGAGTGAALRSVSSGEQRQLRPANGAGDTTTRRRTPWRTQHRTWIYNTGHGYTTPDTGTQHRTLEHNTGHGYITPDTGTQHRTLEHNTGHGYTTPDTGTQHRTPWRTQHRT